MREFGQRVVYLGKQFAYLGLIAGGIACSSYVGYSLFENLIANESPTRIYSTLLQDIQNQSKVTDVIGSTIKGYGADSGRGRRNQVQHVEFNDPSGEYMKLKFHVAGTRNRATIYAQLKKNDHGAFAKEFLFMDVPGEGYPNSKRYVIEDFRQPNSVEKKFRLWD